MSWRNQPSGGNRGAFGSATGTGQSNRSSSGAGGRRGSIGPRAVVLPSLRTSTGESASPPISSAPVTPIVTSPGPSVTLSSSYKDDYAMLADHAWVDEEGEMDYSFVPFSDDQQTLSVSASGVGSSVGLSDGHGGTVQSDAEDPVIKALRKRQQEEIERKREEEIAEKRRLESIERLKQESKPVDVKPVDARPIDVVKPLGLSPLKPVEIKPGTSVAAEELRIKQQARLEEYKRIEEEKKERRRIYEERNQSPVKPAVAPAAMSWRETAQPVFAAAPPVVPPHQEVTMSGVKIAQRPTGDFSGLDSLVTSVNIAAQQIRGPAAQVPVPTVFVVREKTLFVRLDADMTPVKLKFAPSSVAELRTAIRLPDAHYKLDLARHISTSALQ